MKKIFLIAMAALTLGMVACSKDESPVVNNANDPAVSTARVKSASDLIGTEWNYTLELGDGITFGTDSVALPAIVFGLNFDSTYAHFSFPTEVEAYNFVEINGEMTMTQITGVDYEYSYDFSTKTGALIGEAEDDNGNTVTSTLPFTYDETDDVITFVVPVSFDGVNETNVSLIFERAE